MSRHTCKRRVSINVSGRAQCQTMFGRRRLRRSIENSLRNLLITRRPIRQFRKLRCAEACVWGEIMGPVNSPVGARCCCPCDA